MVRMLLYPSLVPKHFVREPNLSCKGQPQSRLSLDGYPTLHLLCAVKRITVSEAKYLSIFFTSLHVSQIISPLHDFFIGVFI